MVRVAFRCDASEEIGLGHFMRCRTLADSLQRRGVRCDFILRANGSHLPFQSDDTSHRIALLPEGGRSADDEAGPPHARWLGVPWELDAEQTLDVMGRSRFDWLVVDHYALDVRWEQRMRASGCRVLAIDDLADRKHACDVLLDQTHGRQSIDYQELVPKECTLLLGAHYALLRPEFADLRGESLLRRKRPRVQRILVSMGGVDRANVTGRVLEVLGRMSSLADCEIVVVLGRGAPHLGEVASTISELGSRASLLVGTDDMARIMATSDLCIGAAGGSAWERCCLGLPSVVLILAENQRKVAGALVDQGAAVLVEESECLDKALTQAIARLIEDPKALSSMSVAAASITEGLGTLAVVAKMEKTLA